MLRSIYRQYPTLAHFHCAKEQLRAFYRAPSLGHAQGLLERLLLALQHADDAELVRWGRTLRAWRTQLLSYHRHRATSAYTEGIYTRSSSSSAPATGSVPATRTCLLAFPNAPGPVARISG